MPRSFATLLVIGVLLFAVKVGHVAAEGSAVYTHARQAIGLTAGDRAGAIAWLVENGGPGAIAPLVQILRFVPAARYALVVDGLAKLAGERAGDDWFDWMIWQQAHPEIAPDPSYGLFLADVLQAINPDFLSFLTADSPHTIRLEEIAWGGVVPDGIPALDHPTMIAADAASYLNPDDQVFGVELNGEERAYPLRIVNWHEMVNDVVGGVPVSLAYCTLCGAGILFDGRVSGREQPLTFGTSGLLYRSNKLMYDRDTRSLWNQFTGRPAIGPLVGSGVVLTVLPLVTTSWQEWYRRHPNTTVLALDTGFVRDYGPGVAYRDYFASPKLMFPALVPDGRLKPKDRVFGLRVPGGSMAWPLSRFSGGAVVNDSVGLLDLVIVGEADGSGARAYESGGRRFIAGADHDHLIAGDETWLATEAALLGPAGQSLPRLPGHLAYWFAWTGYFADAPLGGSP
ncbi:MAG: DUF3179 domain-containing protein [Proteobacteria bacterium]|nr:DUF3179 domain-containing protein [Pseudomonadota bacterium]MBI3496123.1 DUF3179 domain-containing protein [Pseudomonadota bacterium]